MSGVCVVDGCERQHYAKGLCQTHYCQAWRGEALRPIRVKLVGRCAAEGCDRALVVNGYCRAHDARAKAGRPVDGPIKEHPPKRALVHFRHLFTEDPSGCWLWSGSRTHPVWGYGTVSVDGHMVVAHRAVYEVVVGPIPTGMDIDHLCRVRLCVNPAHLEPVTRLENNRRKFAAAKANPA